MNIAWKRDKFGIHLSPCLSKTKGLHDNTNVVVVPNPRKTRQFLSQSHKREIFKLIVRNNLASDNPHLQIPVPTPHSSPYIMREQKWISKLRSTGAEILQRHDLINSFVQDTLMIFLWHFPVWLRLYSCISKTE